MLIDNILFLRDRYPKIRSYFLEHEDKFTRDHIKLMDAKTGVKTIRFDKGDKQLMVHSKYDPQREAERIITSHKEKINEDTHIFFYGIGMGYHIEKFKELYPNNTYSVYEPIPEIFMTMAQEKMLNSVITKNTKHVYIDNHENSSEDYLQEFTSSNRNIHLIILSSYENIIEDKLTHFRKRIKEVILNRRTNLHTDASFQKLWVMNSLMNFETVLNTPNMLKDIDRSQFEGKPALIVSAGPSLVEDIEHIRHIKENNLAYIFSVGSAINSLIEYDLLPDAVFTYDPKPRNQNVFKKMYKSNINSIPMVLGTSVGYETIKKYNGPKVHFITSQDNASLYFLQEQIDLERDLILDSPSIAVMAFQIISKLGANPVIFAGQNLGYLNGRRFARGIEYNHIPSIVDEKTLDKSVTTKDVFGNEIKTNISFNSMRNAIENFVNVYKENTFINTTKGGAAIEGIPFKPIEQVIKEMLTEPIQKQEWWDSKSRYSRIEIHDKYNMLQNSRIDLLEYISSFEELLKLISKNTKIRNKVNLLSTLQRFDNLYNKLNDNLYYERFLSFYLRTEVKYIANEIKRLNQENNIFIRGQGIVSSFTNFLSQCKQGINELNILIQEGINEILLEEGKNE